MIPEDQQILQRWREYFNDFYTMKQNTTKQKREYNQRKWKFNNRKKALQKEKTGIAPDLEYVDTKHALHY